MKINILLLFVLTLFISSLFSKEQVALNEESCFSYYREGKYEKVVDCINSILYTANISDTTRLLKMYEYLGVCLSMQNKNGSARAAFNKLLNLNSDYELNPNMYLPEIISLFQIAKFQKRTSLKVLILDTIPAYPIVYNFLPFGLPQIKNNHKIKGGIVSVLQGAAIAFSIVGFVNKKSFYSEQFHYKEEDLEKAKRFDFMQRISIVGFSLTYVYSIIDGIFNKPIRVME